MCVSRLERYKERTTCRDNIRGLALKARRADMRRMLVLVRGSKNVRIVCSSTQRRATRPFLSIACQDMVRSFWFGPSWNISNQNQGSGRL